MVFLFLFRPARWPEFDMPAEYGSQKRLNRSKDSLTEIFLFR